MAVRKVTPEKLVQNAVVKILRFHGWFVERNQQGLGNRNGRPDLEATRGGVTIRVECKAPAHKMGNRFYPAGKLSPEQEKYINALREHGAIVYIVHDSEVFLREIENLQESMWPGKNVKRLF